MTKKKIKAIIWDLDGTLIDFKINSISARRKAIKILRKYGIPRSKLTIQKSILENVKTSRDLFKKQGIQSNKVQGIIAEVNNAVIEVEHKAALNATLTKGMNEVLEYCKKPYLAAPIVFDETVPDAVLTEQEQPEAIPIHRIEVSPSGLGLG